MIIIFFAVYHANFFSSFDDNVKSSVITEKDNTIKFEILLTFDPSPEILIFILSVSGFTWFLMYRIISLSRLTYAPGIFPGILSIWYKLLISSWHWWNQMFVVAHHKILLSLTLNFSKINNKSLIFCLSSSGQSWYEDLLDDGLKSLIES